MSGIPQVGAEFAGYRIERLLGRGGVGIVYLALDLRLQRRVALKILATELSNDERVRARFTREPRLAASIDHPNIIPIYEAGEAEGNLYIAMRHVDGCDLGALVRREGPLDPARAVAIVAQVGSALDAAHARGLYHRDVKPANILVVPRADAQSSDHAYVADFGITKNSSTRSLTKTGQYVGTLDYVAPEQIRGESVDGRTDIYALGCVLYESLTGVPPFQKDNDAASIYAHLAEDPPVLSAMRSGLPAGLDAVVITAMAKSRDERYPTGAELAAAARRALGERATRGSATRARRRPAATVVATPRSVSDTRVVTRGPAPVSDTRVVTPGPAPVSDTRVVPPRPAPVSDTRVVPPAPERTAKPATAAGAAPAPEPPPHLEFRVLGALEVRDGDRELSVGTGRQRALLARLLMETNMVVSTESLIDALWGDRTPPEAAAKALQTHVTTLRRALEPGRTRGGVPSILVTRSPGYLLRADADDVDLGRFERLVEQGRRLRRSTPERASVVLGEALALWRGPAFDGVSLEGAARAEVTRIEELRLTALEERIEADLELDRHEALLDELTALVAAHPERERLRAQLTLVRARTAEPVPPARDEAEEPAAVAEAPAPGAAAEAAATPPPPPVADTGAAAGERPPRRRRTVPVLAGAAALVAAAVAGAGLLTHSRSGGAGPPPPRTAAPAYPTAAERALLTRFPPFVQNCHRYANHYETAIAEVECQPSPDHPGAHSVVFQQFSNYGDLELHYHHVLALNIQGEVGKPVSAAYAGACADPASGYFAASTYPITGVEAQDGIASPTAHGHLFCYVGSGGIPKLAWTNVGQLVVAQAAGDRSGAQAQSDLLSFWEFAGPTGNPDAVAGSPDAVVKLLYHRYLQRDPESAEALSYWTDRLNAEGFAAVSNAFADSSEAKTRFTLPLMRGGLHGGATPAPAPSPTP